ncbi:MAG TPA: SRPBCC family protein [Acidimicrobiia bacterium]|nr:SRPBCC family protein [Acidimicrobiia bacterium]
MGVRVAVLIEAPLAKVWAAAADLDRHVEWMVDAQSISFRGEQTRGVGTVMEVLTRVGPLSVTDVIEVTAWEPPRRIAVRHAGLVTGTGEFRLDPVAGGVFFTWSEELHFPRRWGGAVTGFLARPLLRWVWKRNLERFCSRILARI